MFIPRGVPAKAVGHAAGMLERKHVETLVDLVGGYSFPTPPIPL